MAIDEADSKPLIVIGVIFGIMVTVAICFVAYMAYKGRLRIPTRT